MSKALELFSKDHRFLEAPTGCGKTHTIAEAVARQQDGVQLVLTHTHAGVHSLLQKLKEFGVSRSKYQLDTIAGWALRLAHYYPKTTKFFKHYPDKSTDYDQIYRGATELLSFPFMKQVISLSYAGTIIDEYQDCTLLQHNLVLALAEIIPCRILGDPLQGIFRFGDKNLFLEWNVDVRNNFDEIPALSHPFRWADKNMPLGRWLLDMRNEIKEGNPIELSRSIIQHIPQPPQAQFQQNLILSTKACGSVANRPGTVAAIHPRNESATHCHNFARKLSGRYQSMEESDAKELQEWAERLDEAHGNARAIWLIDFAAACSTKISTKFKTIRRKFECDTEPTFSPQMNYKDAAQFLMIVSRTNDFTLVSRALKLIKDSVSEAKTFRLDLWTSMLATLQSYDRKKHKSLRAAAWKTRQLQKHMGRKEYQRIVSRTLLIKGLEFDHAVLLDADAFDTNNLYVALTRASKSVTVISAEPVLRPRLNDKQST